MGAIGAIFRFDEVQDTFSVFLPLFKNILRVSYLYIIEQYDVFSTSIVLTIGSAHVIKVRYLHGP